MSRKKIKREECSVVHPEGIKCSNITEAKEKLMALTVPDSKGGTESMMRGLFSRLDIDLLENFQIIPSRLCPLIPDKIHILWVHDLPGDPMYDSLKNGGWQDIDKFVFVSNWQMQNFIQCYDIPWSRCIVLRNAIEPVKLDNFDKNGDGVINLYYGSTPHRGLQILVPVFEKLCEKYDNIELYVHSSFGLYGWAQRDDQFKNILDKCKSNPKIHYSAPIEHDILIDSLKGYHILAYPSIWLETSCLVLLEAMSAGLACVHPNYGALPESAANYTNMYHFHEDQNKHAAIFYHALSKTIDNFSNPENLNKYLKLQKYYIDYFYSWDNRIIEWKALLENMLEVNENNDSIVAPKEEKKVEEGFFNYKVG